VDVPAKKNQWKTNYIMHDASEDRWLRYVKLSSKLTKSV